MQTSIAWLGRDGAPRGAQGDALPVYSLTKTFLAAAILALKIDLYAPR